MGYEATPKQKKMSNSNVKKNVFRPYVDYVPAQVSNGQICRVYYYALNPNTEKLERKVIKCNKVSNKVENKKLAQAIADSITKKLQKGWNPFVEEMTARGHVTLDKAIENFIKSKSKELRADSMRSYVSYAKILSEWLVGEGMYKNFVSSFQYKDAVRFLSMLEEKNIVNKTYNNYLRLSKTLFLWFVEKEYTAKNPFERCKAKRVDEKIREDIPPHIREKIKNYIEENNMYEYYCVIQLCYRCFIRPKEIMMLKVGMVDFRNKTIHIPSTVAKNHKDRIIALPNDIYEFLEKALSCVPKDYYIFSTKYKPGKVLLSSRDTAKTWSKMRKDLGLPIEYKFYSLKDTGITEMLEKGVPTKLVKELADHHSLEMTEKYVHKSSVFEILKYDDLEF